MLYVGLRTRYKVDILGVKVDDIPFQSLTYGNERNEWADLGVYSRHILCTV